MRFSVWECGFGLVKYKSFLPVFLYLFAVVGLRSLTFYLIRTVSSFILSEKLEHETRMLGKGWPSWVRKNSVSESSSSGVQALQ